MHIKFRAEQNPIFTNHSTFVIDGEFACCTCIPKRMPGLSIIPYINIQYNNRLRTLSVLNQFTIFQKMNNFLLRHFARFQQVQLSGKIVIETNEVVSAQFLCIYFNTLSIIEICPAHAIFFAFVCYF